MSSFLVISFVGTLLLGIQGSSFAQNKPRKINQSSVSLKPSVEEAQAVARLERVIPQLMRDAEVTGLSVALIKDAKIVWHKGFGIKNAQTKALMNSSTVLDAGSLSKPVFAYAVLRLVDRDKLDLDAPLTKYLPNAEVGNDARLNLITARRVLSHTTGFPNWRRGQPLKIYFSPGERFSYSGEGFEYLQKVVERVTGEPLNEFMKKEVFAPLGMTGSSYIWEQRFDTLKAFGHDIAGGVSQRQQPAEAHAAYSLQTTALDYAKFIRAILLGTGLKKETASQMLSPQIKAGEDCINDCFNPLAGRLSSSISWGLGLGLQHAERRDSFWHWGDNGEFNFRCYFEASKYQKTGIVILTNSANGFSVVPEIVRQAMGGEHPALAWTRAFEPYNSPAKVLLRTILAKGADVALRQYRESRRTRSGNEVLTERQMNNLGYQLLDVNKVREAIEVFKLNVEDFPNSANAYDSLAEAYMVNGDKELAIKNYKRSIELNPNNKTGIEMLKKLEGKN